MPFDENGHDYELRNMFCYEMGEDKEMEHLPSLSLLPSSLGLVLSSMGLLTELVFLVMPPLMDGIATLVANVGAWPRELNLRWPLGMVVLSTNLFPLKREPDCRVERG